MGKGHRTYRTGSPQHPTLLGQPTHGLRSQTGENHDTSEHLQQTQHDERQFVGFHLCPQRVNGSKEQRPEKEQQADRTEGVPGCIASPAIGRTGSVEENGKFPCQQRREQQNKAAAQQKIGPVSKGGREAGKKQ